MRELNRFLMSIVLLLVVGLVAAAYFIPQVAQIVYALGAIAIAIVILWAWLQSG